MSNIKLTKISAPNLNTSGYGANIKTQFDNIDANFTSIVQGEYLKGQSGDIVMLEEIDLIKDQSEVNLSVSALQIKNSFLGYISNLGLGSSPNGIGSINSRKLYMIYTKNEETKKIVYKSSLPYTFLDPRFNPVSDSAKDEGLEDKSCIIIYDEKEGFKSYNAFPNIYFDGNQDEFCWKINGQKTLLPARGPKGDTGYTGAVYILSTTLPSDYDPQNPQYARVNFLIVPPKYKQWDKSYIMNDDAKELKDQAAFVYANVKDNNGNNKQYIYISQIEVSEESGTAYAVCHLDESCEIHHFFANQTLKDVLTEVKPGSDFNYLFIPSGFNGDKLKEAHVVTTKRSGDNISAPRPGFWWDGYNQNDWNNRAYSNICIISPATIGATRTLKEITDNSNSGLLYNNYKTSICPGGAFFGRIATGSICFDDATNSLNNKWIISQDPLNYTLLMGGPIAGGDENNVYISNSSLRVDGNATIGNELVSKTIKLKDGLFSDVTYNGNPTFSLDAQTGGMRLDSLNVVGDARFGKIDSLNYEVPSLDLSNDYNNNIPNPETITRHLVYLTWNTHNTDGDIPNIANISDSTSGKSKNFLQAGKPKYIINTTEIRGGNSISGRATTDIHLTFDMSKDWPPTQIEWNFGRTPETISFANGKVKIYTDFKINTDGNTDNYIIVQKGVSGIDFSNYIGELNQVTSILLTPYDAASTPDCKAYKLTFENAGAFSYTDEITGVENRLMAQLSRYQIEIQNEYLPKSQLSWANISDAPEIPVMAMDNDNITIRSGNHSFVFPTNINNRIQNQIDSTLSGKDYVTRGTKFHWNDIEGAPEIPEFDFDGDTVTLKAGKSSFTLPSNINSKIQTQIEATLSDKDFVTKGTLTMMGGFNSSNSGTNSGNTETTIRILNQQSEGYVITDFCSFLVRYLDGNQEVDKTKYLQWPIKGNIIRGVYHPSESAGTLSMMIDVKNPSTTVTITTSGNTQIEVNVKDIKIDGRNTTFGLGCSYGESKTVPWEVKLENVDYNFKTSISGYLTITYEAL